MIPELGPIRILAWIPAPRGETMLGYFDVSWGPFVIRRMTLHGDDSGAYSVGVPLKKDSAHGSWIHLSILKADVRVRSFTGLRCNR